MDIFKIENGRKSNASKFNKRQVKTQQRDKNNRKFIFWKFMIWKREFKAKLKVRKEASL